jgi:hypothetical protein
MRVAIVFLTALLAAAPSIAWAQSDCRAQVILLDVQGLWGGTELWVSEAGKGVCRFVRAPAKGESGLQEARYAFDLSKEQRAALCALLDEHRFFEMETADRPGVPDEARPVIFVKSGGRARTVGKWANDRHQDFDPVYEFLLKIAESAKKSAPTGRGPYDRSWKPEGFPSSREVLDKAEARPAKAAKDEGGKGTMKDETIGTARMEADGTLVLTLRAEGAGGVIGDAQFVYPLDHPQYRDILRHLGGLEPGQEKPVPSWE